MMFGKRGLGRAVLVGAFLVASLSAPRCQEKFTAGEMQTSCKAVLDTAKAAKNADELELDNTFDSGTCWGAFLSIQQFIVTKVEGGKATILDVCTPPDLSLVQIIQIFDFFVRSNPKRKAEPFTKVAIAALRSAFPCKPSAFRG